MRHLKLLIFAAMAMFFTACSTSREATPANIAAHNNVVRMIQDKNFMVKADRLVLDKRSFPSVSPITNFVLVDGDEATVQISPGVGGGPNGVGGFTVKGRVSGYELNVRSNGSVTLKFNVQAAVGSCTVFLNLPKNGINANVTINNTLRGKNAVIYGDVTAIDTTVYVGRSVG